MSKEVDFKIPFGAYIGGFPAPPFKFQ